MSPGVKDYEDCYQNINDDKNQELIQSVMMSIEKETSSTEGQISRLNLSSEVTYEEVIPYGGNLRMSSKVAG